MFANFRKSPFRCAFSTTWTCRPKQEIMPSSASQTAVNDIRADEAISFSWPTSSPSGECSAGRNKPCRVPTKCQAGPPDSLPGQAGEGMRWVGRMGRPTEFPRVRAEGEAVGRRVSPRGQKRLRGGAGHGQTTHQPQRLPHRASAPPPPTPTPAGGNDKPTTLLPLAGTRTNSIAAKSWSFLPTFKLAPGASLPAGKMASVSALQGHVICSSREILHWSLRRHLEWRQLASVIS